MRSKKVLFLGFMMLAMLFVTACRNYGNNNDNGEASESAVAETASEKSTETINDKSDEITSEKSEETANDKSAELTGVQQETISNNEDSVQMPEEEQTDSQKIDEQGDENMNESIFYIKVGTGVLSAVFENNSSAYAFRELLKEGDVTVSMSDYGNFEKVGSLGTTLPRNDMQITTVPGDVILYQGNSITIYYDTNSWNFTRLGKIDGATTKSMKEFLGEGTVEVVFSLNQ